MGFKGNASEAAKTGEKAPKRAGIAGLVSKVLESKHGKSAVTSLLADPLNRVIKAADKVGTAYKEKVPRPVRIGLLFAAPALVAPFVSAERISDGLAAGDLPEKVKKEGDLAGGVATIASVLKQPVVAAGALAIQTVLGATGEAAQKIIDGAPQPTPSDATPVGA